MKKLDLRAGARHLAVLSVATLALGGLASVQVVAKKAPDVSSKRSVPSNELRANELKQEQPGPAFERAWRTFSSAVASKRPASQRPLFGDAHVFARFSAMTGAPRVVYGDLGEAPAAAKRGDRAMLWLGANADVFGVDTSQLEVARAIEFDGIASHIYYAQKYRGLPGFASEVAVHMDRNAHVVGVTNSFTPVSVSKTTAEISAEAAYQAALAAVGVEPAAVIADAGSERELGIWPTADGGRLAYRVTFSSTSPAGTFEAIVDAATGESLAAPRNLMCTVDGVGKVFTPNPVVTEGNNNLTDGSVIPEGDYYPVTLFGLDGSGKLIGTYSQVHPSLGSPVVRANNDFSDLRRTTVQYDEEEVYWAIDTAAQTYVSLGYTVGNGNPIMNYSIKVYAHNSPTWGNQDNSSFSSSNIDGTGTGILEFGTGGVDDASDAEIIWHEYGHATLWNQRPGINQNVSREGIGEGFGDYLAGSLSKHQIGSWTYGVTVGEWDAVSYNPGNPPYLRRLDTATFWENRPTEVHSAGEIWSHPCFDYDQQVGADLALKVVLRAHFLFDLSPTQAEGAAAMVQAEQLVTGGATVGQVQNAFYERHTLSGTVHPVIQTPGVAVPGTNTFFLRNSSTAGVADLTVGFGIPSQTPLVGDWNGNGSDTVGVYDPSSGAFFLRNSNDSGPANVVFGYGFTGSNVIPVVGDWDGNGTETVGIYDTNTGNFFLRNSNSPGSADLVFSLGAGGADFLPVAGDWDGNGTDTIGIYRISTGTFFLKNSNSGGAADLVFGFGAGGAGTLPITGDWNGDGVDTVGVYIGSTATYFLRNTNTPGSADVAFNYGPANAKPVSGDWNGGMHPFNPFGS